MLRLCPLFLVAIILAPAASAQFQNQITTSYAAGNGCYGNLFDVGATNDLSVCSFDIHLDAGTPASTINVWAVTGGGSWLTNQGSAANWTLLATTTVTGAGIGVPTPLSLNLGYPIPAGTVQGFVIEKTVGAAPNIRYSNGTAYGSIEATNADVTIYGGGGICAPGGFTANTTRNWNGTMHYELGLNSSCGVTSAPPWQVNSTISSLDLDGVAGSTFQGAETTVCIGGTTILNSNSTAGTPTDIAVVFAPHGPTMALSSFNNTVNIDVLHPTMFSFNGGAPNFAGLLNLQPHPGAFSFLVPTGGPFVGSAQQLAVDPSNADGYALSQASQLTVTVGGTVTFAHADDGFVQAFINAPPLCGTSVDFYGTSYTDIFSNSNGWASFTAGNADFTATVAEWQTNEPRLGFGADLEPNNFGTVTLTNLGPALSGSPGASNLVMSYAGVTEWGTGGLGVTSYDIVLNGPNGHEIANFTTDGTWGATAVVAGMTFGAGGTHPAQVSFDGLFGTGRQANVAGTDSVLDGNAAGMLANASGWSNIVFPLLDGSAYLVL